MPGCAGGGGGSSSILLIVVYLVVIFGAMYFIMIRPQNKKRKEEEKLRNDVKIGDEILTIGGIYARVVAIKEDSLIIESGPDRDKLRIARWGVQQNLTVHDDATTKEKGKPKFFGNKNKEEKQDKKEKQ